MTWRDDRDHTHTEIAWAYFRLKHPHLYDPVLVNSPEWPFLRSSGTGRVR